MEIEIYDINKKQIKEGHKVRVLYTDWINKEKDSKIGVVTWIPKEGRYMFKFDTKDRYGDYEYGDLLVGLHGELEIIS